MPRSGCSAPCMEWILIKIKKKKHVIPYTKEVEHTVKLQNCRSLKKKILDANQMNILINLKCKSQN